jgi:wyosine [tRNA(Phe)-imidazoG37] synthetase (radical SAM superfamily)
MRLSTRVHDRDSAGLLYVYPVVSRRAGGVSVGINLNPNDACNWRCVYCQVPGLVRGGAPPIDLERLERELDSFLGALLEGGWMQSEVPEDARVLKDVAFSGNGEPTSSRQLAEAIEVVGRVLHARGLAKKIDVVLITNGSLVHQQPVQQALAALADLGGEVWFKLDSATEAGRRATNDVSISGERVRANLETAARLAPTWIQTIAFARGGEPPSHEERDAYLALIRELVASEVPLRGVLLYGLARASHQPEAGELSALPSEWLDEFAREIEAAGLPVRVHA